MKTVSIKDHVIKLYDSIDELPIAHFQKYNKCVLIDSALGSDVDSVDSHIVNVVKHLNAGNKEQAVKELQNMRQNLHMIVSNVSPKHLAFAALIHSIDGKVNTDLSDSHLQEILDELNEMPHGLLVDILLTIKKKLSTELELYFPSEFDSAKEKEAYDRLRQRTLLQLQEVSDGVDNSDGIAAIDAMLFNMRKPKCFCGKESEEIKYDKQFESACMIVSQKTGMFAKGMTVLEFYNTMVNLQKQAEAEKKAYSKHK